MIHRESNREPLDNNVDENVSPGPQYQISGVLKQDWPLLLLFALAFAGAAWIYPALPERVPIHWDIHNQVNGWGSRGAATFGLLGIFLGIYILMLLAPLIDPRRANYSKFLPTYRILRWLIVLVFLGIWTTATASAQGKSVRIDRIIPMIVSLLFVILGNFLGRLRYNWFVGIRTPWSLDNEEAWRLTHRASGPAWVIGGLIAFAGAWMGETVSVLALALGLGGASVFSVVYSYFAYRRSISETTTENAGSK